LIHIYGGNPYLASDIFTILVKFAIQLQADDKSQAVHEWRIMNNMASLACKLLIQERANPNKNYEIIKDNPRGFSDERTQLWAF
jgi:hypothetical protein